MHSLSDSEKLVSCNETHKYKDKQLGITFMNITEIVNLSEAELKEQKRVNAVVEEMNKNIREYMESLRLHSLMFEAPGDDNVIQFPGTRREPPVDASAAPSTPAAANDDQPIDRSSQRRRDFGPTLRRSFLRRYRQPILLVGKVRTAGIVSLGMALGITYEWEVAGFGDEIMDTWWRAAQNGYLVAMPNGYRSWSDFPDMASAQEHLNANIARYERMVGIAYGSLMAFAYAGTLAVLVGPVYRISRRTLSVAASPGVQAIRLVRNPGATVANWARNVRKFIRWARTMRNVYSAAAAGIGAVFGAGIGGLVSGVVTFILGSAAIWIAEQVLIRSGYGEYIIESLVYWVLQRDLDAGLEELGTGSSVGEILLAIGLQADNVHGAVADQLDDQELQQNLRDVRNDILTNPRAQETDRDAASILVPPGTNDSRAPTSNNGGGSPTSTNGGGASGANGSGANGSTAGPSRTNTRIQRARDGI